jgi:hypothetical protein
MTRRTFGWRKGRNCGVVSRNDKLDFRGNWISLLFAARPAFRLITSVTEAPMSVSPEEIISRPLERVPSYSAAKKEPRPRSRSRFRAKSSSGAGHRCRGWAAEIVRSPRKPRRTAKHLVGFNLRYARAGSAVYFVRLRPIARYRRPSSCFLLSFIS